jgi:Holliday junction resolvasome RuvABC endonuclease subunit
MGSIAGFDFDSNGIFGVLIDEDTGAWLGKMQADLACGPGDAADRARRVRDLMPARESWVDAGVTAIGLESTFSRDFRAATALCRIQGAIIACLPRSLPLHLLTANGRRTPGWKILTVGKTNASKDEVRQWALDLNHGAPPGLPQDLYDAFAIARATRRLERPT